MKPIIATLLLGLVGITSWVSCCQPQRGGSEPQPPPPPDFGYEESQLRKTAVLLGCSPSKADQMSLEELVFEVTSRVQNVRRVKRDDALSNEDLKWISLAFEEDLVLLEKIKDNENLLKQLRGKRILILPDAPESSNDSSGSSQGKTRRGRR